MSRIQGVEAKDANWRTRILFWLIKRKLGRVSKISKIKAHWPKFLELTSRMDALVAAPGTVPDSLRELAQLKVAALVGCPF